MANLFEDWDATKGALTDRLNGNKKAVMEIILENTKRSLMKAVMANTKEEKEKRAKCAAKIDKAILPSHKTFTALKQSTNLHLTTTTCLSELGGLAYNDNLPSLTCYTLPEDAIPNS